MGGNADAGRARSPTCGPTGVSSRVSEPERRNELLRGRPVFERAALLPRRLISGEKISDRGMLAARDARTTTTNHSGSYREIRRLTEPLASPFADTTGVRG